MVQFKGKLFKQDSIYGYRDVSEILRERGIDVCHTTVYRWVQEYSQISYYFWKKRNQTVGDSWRMDETYIKVKGKRHYLYRALILLGFLIFNFATEP